MSRQVLLPLVCCASLAVVSLVVAGCGSEAAPLTAESTQFRPAGDAEIPPAAAPAAAPPARDPAQPPTLAPGQGVLAKGNAPAAAGAAIAVPDGDIKTLSAYIDRLGRQQPEGATQQEMIADFARTADARLTAVKKILAQKPDETTKIAAINVAFEIFGMLNQLEVPGTRAKMAGFADEMSQHSDPELARLGRFMALNFQVRELAAKSPDDGTEIVALAKRFAEQEQDKLTDETLTLIGGAADVLFELGLKDDGLAVLNLAADTAAASKDEKVAAEQHTYRDRAAMISLDAESLLKDVIVGEKDAQARLSAKLKETMELVQPSPEVVQRVQEIAYLLEATGNGAASLDALDQLKALVAKSSDPEFAEKVIASVDKAHQRAALVGQPLTVEGVLLDGQPFDWSAYQGKVVLLDFWATWCGPCLKELPNIQRNYEEFRELGFDVVGVSLDTEKADLDKFFKVQDVPWTVITTPEVLDGSADKENWTDLPMAKKVGIAAIPFLVLIGKDGKVDSVHVQGPKLRARLTQLLGNPDGSPAETKPDEAKPAEKPVEDKPVEDKPAENQAALATPVGLAVALALLGADEPAAAPPAQADDPAINPYAAKPGLSPEQLTSYILKMADKPKTIQGRPGFCDAVCAACDRVLSADPPASEVQFFVAAESKFETLHKQACTGDAEADKLLAAFVAKMQDDQRPRIARQVAFFQHERQVLDAGELPVEKIPDLLKELQEYYTKEKLTARHLRMASSTVALINKLENGDDREQHFGQFGGAFAKSSDKELARYGKKLAKKPAILESDLVGKPLVLAGGTAKGATFVWEAYRGKVVLVDFWATWCGPCRREMPGVKALHEKYADRGFEVVGVSLDEDQEALAAYLEENEIPWETLAGEGTQELADQYGVRGIPTMMLVDKAGNVVAVSHGVAPLAPLAEKLLSGSGAAEKAK